MGGKGSFPYELRSPIWALAAGVKKNVAGISKIDMGTDGSAFVDLDPFAEAFSLLEQANAEATAIVMNARTWGDLMKLCEQTGSLKPLLSESAGSPTGGVHAELRLAISGLASSRSL